MFACSCYGPTVFPLQRGQLRRKQYKLELEVGISLFFQPPSSKHHEQQQQDQARSHGRAFQAAAAITWRGVAAASRARTPQGLSWKGADVHQPGHSLAQIPAPTALGIPKSLA